MLIAGGKSSREHETDLYLYIEGSADELHDRLKDKVEITFAPVDRFFNMREFAIRDLNGFQLIFGGK